MNLFIILFLISLTGIVIMVGWKLRKVANGEILPEVAAGFELGTIHFEEWRRNFLKVIRGLFYFLLVEIIRVYVRLSESSKREWQELKQKLHDRFLKKEVLDEKGRVRREPNKFLKSMELYKRRIKKIKERVREEEGLDA